MQNLIDSELFLSDEEKYYKKILLSILNHVDKAFDELSFKKTITDEVDIDGHFKELVRQIDIIRDESKDKIDKFSLKFIELIKNFSLSYKDSFRADFNQFKLSHSLKENQSNEIIESLFSGPFIPDGFLFNIKNKYVFLYYSIQKKISEYELIKEKSKNTNMMFSSQIEIEKFFNFRSVK